MEWPLRSGKSAYALAARGELDDAERALEEAVDLARKHGNARSVGCVAEVTRAALRSCAATARGPGDCSTRVWTSTEAWTTHGVSRSLSPTSRCSPSRRASRDGARNCSPRLSRSNARAAITFGSRTRSSCRRGSRQRTGSHTLAIRLYARAALIGEATTRWLHYELGWPDPTPDLDDLRSRVGEEAFDGGVDARPRDDAPRGNRPGDPGAARGRAGRAIALAARLQASPHAASPELDEVGRLARALHGERFDRSFVCAVDRPVLADRANGLRI